MPNREIKAVLFDSGDTLLRPIGGAWFPRPVLRRLFQKSGVEIVASRLDAAHNRGMHFLYRHHHISTEEEEVAQFRQFYAIGLSDLGIVAEPGTIEDLAFAEIQELSQESARSSKSCAAAGFGSGSSRMRGRRLIGSIAYWASAISSARSSSPRTSDA